MKQPLKENGGLPASILWTLAIVAGISVANIYYVQPLLNMIRHELGISEFRTNLIAMVTQIDRKSTRLNSSHMPKSRMPSSA